MQFQQRVERGAVQQRAAVAGDQRIQPLAPAGGRVRGVAIREVPEGRVRSRRQEGRLRDLQRAAELVLVLRVRPARVLVEPLGRQGFRRDAPALPAGLVADARAHHRLPAMR